MFIAPHKQNVARNWLFAFYPTQTYLSCADPEGGGQGVQKNHKNIGFLCDYTDADSLKNHKATKPAFNVGPSSNLCHIISRRQYM